MESKIKEKKINKQPRISIYLNLSVTLLLVKEALSETFPKQNKNAES